MTLARMRTAQGVHDIIKELDPHTGITVCFIRKIINSGNIQVVCTGNRKLVDADKLIEYISNGAPGLNEPQEPVMEYGTIRAIQA